MAAILDFTNPEMKYQTNMSSNMSIDFAYPQNLAIDTKIIEFWPLQAYFLKSQFSRRPSCILRFLGEP